MLIRMNKPRITFHQALKLLAERERTLGIRRQANALVADTSGNKNSNHGNNDHGRNRDNRQNDRQDNHRDSYRQDNYRGRGSYRGRGNYLGRYRHRGNWRNYRGRPYDRQDNRQDNRSDNKDKDSVCTHCGWQGHKLENCKDHKRAQRRIANRLMGVHANAATTAASTTPAATALTACAAASNVDAESEYCCLSNRITFMEDVDEV